MEGGWRYEWRESGGMSGGWGGSMDGGRGGGMDGGRVEV